MDRYIERWINRDTDMYVGGWMDRWMPVRTKRLKKRKRKLCGLNRFFEDGRCMEKS